MNYECLILISSSVAAIEINLSSPLPPPPKKAWVCERLKLVAELSLVCCIFQSDLNITHSQKKILKISWHHIHDIHDSVTIRVLVFKDIIYAHAGDPVATRKKKY